MNRWHAPVAVAFFFALAGCGTAGPSPAVTPAATAPCPSLGQAVDRYLAQVKAHRGNPELSFAGCTPEQIQQRISDMQLLVNRPATRTENP